jgi:hypothetical protein
MSTIVFRGKTYNSVFEMPDEIRQAYQREKQRPVTANKTNPGLFTNLFEMPEEVRGVYQRALQNLDEKTAPSKTFSDSPPKDIRSSDESLYKPSPPIIQEIKPAIKPESGTTGFIVSVAVFLMLLGLAYLVTQLML